MPEIVRQQHSGERAGHDQPDHDTPNHDNRFLALFPRQITAEKKFSQHFEG